VSEFRKSLAAVVLVSAAAATACGQAGGATSSAAADSAAVGSARRIVVETFVVEPQPYVEEVAVTGSVEADRDVTVASEESGVIRALYVDKGRAVQEGQPIAKLDDAVIRAQYEQAKAEAELARETWERQRRLWEEDKIGSEMNYLRARYGAETAEAAARVLAARLERTTVRAPISGVLEDRLVEIGSTVMPGAPVARIVDLDPVKVSAGVPERYAGEIRTGATVQLEFDRADGRVFTGRTTYVGATVEPGSRTFPIEVSVANAGGALKPGVVARLRIERRTMSDALLVPREAVIRGESGYMVYVVVRDGDRAIVETRSVETGPGSAGRVVVSSGIAAGAEVIIVGQQQVTGGDVVEVANRDGGGR
jgi:membrane fusion protein, multidrug efflux system